MREIEREGGSVRESMEGRERGRGREIIMGGQREAGKKEKEKEI